MLIRFIIAQNMIDTSIALFPDTSQLCSAQKNNKLNVGNASWEALFLSPSYTDTVRGQGRQTEGDVPRPIPSTRQVDFSPLGAVCIIRSLVTCVRKTEAEVEGQSQPPFPPEWTHCLVVIDEGYWIHG